VIEDRPLSAEAKAAGVISDQHRLAGVRREAGRTQAAVAGHQIACTPHRKRLHNGRGGPEQGEFLLIATDLLDLPAEVIALITGPAGPWRSSSALQARAGLPAPAGHREDGSRSRSTWAVIACMLITLWSGRKPTLRTVEMVQFYFTGWATEEELDATSRS